jgi:hypothetical protein
VLVLRSYVRWKFIFLRALALDNMITQHGVYLAAYCQPIINI